MIGEKADRVADIFRFEKIKIRTLDLNMGISTLFVAVFATFIFCVNCQDELPKIAMEPKTSNVYLKEGGEQVMTCTSTSTRADINLIWVTPEDFLQDKKLGFVKEKIVIYNEGTKPKTIMGHKAELHVINHKRDGQYRCEVVNDKGETLNNFPVQFHTVTEEVQDATYYRENKTLTISCKISVKEGTVGEPVWKQNGTKVEELQSEIGGEFVPSGENLTINEVMRSDAALYTAEYPIKKDDKDTDPFMYPCNVALNADPLVLDFEKSKNLIQEDKLELHCKILGYPIVKVDWYKDNELILTNTSSHVMKMDHEGIVNATVKINSVSFDDAGEYKCIAYGPPLNDPKANSSKTITVRVKDKFAALWPFLGIVGEVIVLCTIIFIYEKRRSRQAEQEEAAQDEPDGAATDRSEGLRHRNTANNPRA